ncbi:MAG: phytanoyl-CoA dioxygenase family protein [Actinomycetota bacterium]
MTDLDATLALADEVVASFRRDGQVVVPGVVDASAAARLRDRLVHVVPGQALDTRPLEERDTYGRAFLQAMNLWRVDDEIAAFVHAPRFAALAAQLLEEPAVRLYHDQALWKEAGGGATPWHQDQVYWPLDTDRTITMWLALDEVEQFDGGLRFVPGSHRDGALAGEAISDESERRFEQLIADGGLSIRPNPPMRPGDASFHLGWTLHGSAANTSGRERAAMTVIWFADGARLVEPDSPERRNDAATWLPGVDVGAAAASPLNPVLWPR